MNVCVDVCACGIDSILDILDDAITLIDETSGQCELEYAQNKTFWNVVGDPVKFLLLNRDNS